MNRHGVVTLDNVGSTILLKLLLKLQIKIHSMLLWLFYAPANQEWEESLQFEL